MGGLRGFRGDHFPKNVYIILSWERQKAALSLSPSVIE